VAKVTAEPAKKQSTAHAITAEEAAPKYQAFRDQHPDTLTAEQSALNWLEYRNTHGPGPTAEDSIKEWKAFRDAGPGDEDKEAKSRGRDNDYGLE
jgi:hypothetical protein